MNMQKIRLWIVLHICWLKNPAIWLDENILTLTSGTKSFIWDLCRNTANNMNFDYRTISVKISDKIFQQIQKTLFFGHFCSKQNFSKESGFVHDRLFPKSLSCTTLYGFLGPCQNLEKTSDAIRRQFLERRKDGRTDRPYFIKAFQLLPGVQ